MNIKVFIWFFLAPVLLLMQGCLENNLIPDFNQNMDNSAEMLVYFESHGDYINSMDSPWLIDASEVAQNSNSFLIIDTRSVKEFSEGRIVGAIRLDSKDIPVYFKKNAINNYAKVVIVSQAGQSSSYYTTLLHLLGYNNVYSLNFGMAGWNTRFSSIWMQNTNNSPEMLYYTNESGKRNPMTQLPKVTFRTYSQNIKDKIGERISLLFSEGFNEETDYPSEDVKGPSIFADRLFGKKAAEYYLVCYGGSDLYEAIGLFNPYSPHGHPPGAVSYAQHSSLRSSSFLQTLPADKKIGIYCYNGQYSASAAAYLRVLGYDAKSMLFGANALFFSRMNWDTRLQKYAFQKYGATEYPIETGE